MISVTYTLKTYHKSIFKIYSEWTPCIQTSLFSFPCELLKFIKRFIPSNIKSETVIHRCLKDRFSESLWKTLCMCLRFGIHFYLSCQIKSLKLITTAPYAISCHWSLSIRDQWHEVS